jgi:hypothetical protein
MLRPYNRRTRTAAWHPLRFEKDETTNAWSIVAELDDPPDESLQTTATIRFLFDDGTSSVPYHLLQQGNRFNCSKGIGLLLGEKSSIDGDMSPICLVELVGWRRLCCRPTHRQELSRQFIAGLIVHLQPP